MMLNNVNDSRLDEILLKQEQVWRDRTPPELEWDESEESLVVEDMLGGSHRNSHDHS